MNVITKKLKTFQIILSLIIIFNMIILVKNKNYTELDLKLKLNQEDNDFLYILKHLMHVVVGFLLYLILFH